MKIAFFEVSGWEVPVLKAKLRKHSMKFFSEPLTLENVNFAKGFDIVSVFIYSKVTAEVIHKLPRLKAIATRSTGFDHIDIRAAGYRNISVSYVPSYGENTVAEHTFALILSLSRNVHKSYVRTLRNDFSIEGLKGFDLKGRTIGVIGAGKIGLHVIRVAKGFGMDVVAFDINKDNFIAEVLGFRYLPLDELLKVSDIITLHAPYNEHTHHLISKDNIKLIKKGALLINTARGGLVDTAALLEALDKGILSGAGLDVLEGEELIKEEKEILHSASSLETLKSLLNDHVILAKDNVVFTPHIAFYSQEALLRILDTTIENITSFSEKKPRNTIK